MTPVGILTDTSSSIPEEMAQELKIEVVPYHVIREGQDLRDMYDVKPDEFAAYLGKTDKLPTTSCPNVGDYLAGFKNLAERTREIVALTMTTKGSGAYQSCRAAIDIFRERMPSVRVEVIDTLQVAMSHGWAVIEAARAALEGANVNGVLEKARGVAQKGMMIQTADTLRYLYMGGRIGRAQHLVGTMLNIKPLIGMEDGVIVALGTARSRPKAYAKMAEMVSERIGQGAKARVAFMHCAAFEQAELLQRQVLDRVDCAEVFITALSPALAVHTGPGMVGLSFVPV